MSKPIVMVIRDPDCANDYIISPPDSVDIIDVDLGSFFNGPRDFDADTNPDQAEWAWGLWQEVADLPDDNPVKKSMLRLFVDMSFDPDRWEDDPERPGEPRKKITEEAST